MKTGPLRKRGVQKLPPPLAVNDETPCHGRKKETSRSGAATDCKTQHAVIFAIYTGRWCAPFLIHQLCTHNIKRTRARRMRFRSKYLSVSQFSDGRLSSCLILFYSKIFYFFIIHASSFALPHEPRHSKLLNTVLIVLFPSEQMFSSLRCSSP